MEVLFRRAVLEDVSEIIDLCNECFDEKTELSHAQEIFKESCHDKNQIYLVGLLNGKVMAHAKITVIPTIYKSMGTFAILNHVCVKEEYRRHNIATLMLEEIEKICKEVGCASMKLWSKNFLIPAHVCYKRFGYEPVDATFFSMDLVEEQNEY